MSKSRSGQRKQTTSVVLACHVQALVRDHARGQDVEMLYYLANNCSVSTLYRFTLKKNKLLSDAPQFLAR